MNFPKRIKAARQKLGLSCRQAALQWGFRVATVNHWERGTRNPCGLYRDKLEAALKEIEAR